MSSISSKKQPKTHGRVVKTNSFVRFLEEFMAWQFAFEIIGPLGLNWILDAIWSLNLLLNFSNFDFCRVEVSGFYRSYTQFGKFCKRFASAFENFGTHFTVLCNTNSLLNKQTLQLLYGFKKFKGNLRSVRAALFLRPLKNGRDTHERLSPARLAKGLLVYAFTM